MAQSYSPRPGTASFIILTTAQWNERAAASWIINRGCACIEIVSANKFKLKFGTGDKHYRELPYIGNDGGQPPMDDYYTKEEVDAIINNLQYMSVASTQVYPSPDTLPGINNKLGDVRFVRNPDDSTSPIPYMWNDSKWIPFASVVSVDLSAYAKKSEVNPRLDSLEAKAHTHSNKDVLDRVTQNVINYSHTHMNKTVLDQITQTLINNSHTHTNKAILDNTTASYTIPEKEKLASLHDYLPFTGTDGTSDGTAGLVPAPTTHDIDKFLASDGTWKTVQGGGGSDISGSGTVGSIAKFTGTHTIGDATLSTVSVGSATEGTPLEASNVTDWTPDTPTSCAISQGVLTFSAGAPASLSYDAQSIPNISVTSETVVSGIT